MCRVGFIHLLTTLIIWGVWHFKAPKYQTAIYLLNVNMLKFSTIRAMFYDRMLN